MSENLDRVKGYLLDLDLTIVTENESEELVVVDDEDNGIKQLVIDCEPPIVVLEQLIAEVPAEPGDLFKRLLQMNNTLVHGAFVLGIGFREDVGPIVLGYEEQVVGFFGLHDGLQGRGTRVRDGARR